MATKLMLTLPKDLTEQEQHTLRLLLLDALGEFAARRFPADTYVAERYPESEGYDWLVRPDKIKEVQNRISLAQLAHSSVFDMTVEVIK